MSGCFAWLIFAGGAVLIMASLLRWFEQVADTVDQGDWKKLFTLTVFPFAVWLYPSRYAAGRPTAVPHHEPVRGFGKVPKMPADTNGPAGSSIPVQASPVEQSPAASTPLDQPPPGTPAEFIGLPTIPPKKPRAPIDPEKLAKLKQKMRDQGMLDQ